MNISEEIYAWLHSNHKDVLEELEGHLESIGTATTESVQRNLESVMHEMRKSDFRGLVSGEDQDYDNALEHVKAAHVSLGIAQVKLNG